MPQRPGAIRAYDKEPPPYLLSQRRPASRHPLLSIRQIEVLDLIAQGYSNLEIAEALFLSEETVKTHVRHLIAKLQAKNRAHCVHKGHLLGIL